jgi:DNA-binding HxlR family transcriptional regulator
VDLRSKRLSILLLSGNERQKKAMKNPIDHLNKLFDSRVRLGIMSTLMVNADMNFNELKELLQITDGNLASHLKALEAQNIISVSKGFIGRKTNTMYRITKFGEKAFKAHLDALEKMIRATK